MKVQKIQTQQPKFKAIRIVAKENKDVKFLYNKVSDTIQKQGVTTVFTRDYIQMDRLTEYMRAKFEEFGIKFKNIKEKKINE